MFINTHNEWDPLKEVIIGRAAGAQVPTVKDASLHAINYGDKSTDEFMAAPCSCGGKQNRALDRRGA